MASVSPLAFASSPLVRTTRPALQPSSTAPASSSCECTQTFNLACEQGQTLHSQITITLDGAPVDVTGGEFQFTAKTDPTLPDSDPTVLQVDWQEFATPTLGQTWLSIPAATTATMAPVGYYYQIRYVSPSSIVTPLAKGVLTIVVPISSRYT